jgi:hypothetical protein
MKNLDQLFEEHALASYDKQMCLAEVVGERSWHTDLEDGLIVFGDDISFKLQIIGTHSNYDNTWLWAWANTRSGLPEELLNAAHHLRKYGEQHGIDELVTPKFRLDDYDGHYLAMIASGLCRADCYYRAPYDEGAAFLIIEDAPAVKAQADLSAHSIIGRFTEFISGWELRHRPALEAYLEYKGYSADCVGDDALRAYTADGEDLSVEFDDDGRLKKMETTVRPPSRNPSKKPWWKLWGRNDTSQ